MCRYCERIKEQRSKCYNCSYIGSHPLGEPCCKCIPGIFLPMEFIPGSMIHAVKVFKKDSADRYIDFWASVGLCRIVSLTFERLCKKMKIQDIATISFGGYESGFYHAANIYNKTIIIDWTFRQFQKDCKIPVIEHIDNYRFSRR